VAVVVRAGSVLEPVMVSENVPVGVVGEVVTFILELFPVAGLGLKLAPAPAGRPVAESVTPPAKPPVRAMLTV
jgi:hypothetical protein